MYNFWTQHVLSLYFSCNSMNNLSSYCARMRASEKDLPALNNLCENCIVTVYLFIQHRSGGERKYVRAKGGLIDIGYDIQWFMKFGPMQCNTFECPIYCLYGRTGCGAFTGGIVKWNLWILRIGVMGRCQKSKNLTFKVNFLHQKSFESSWIFHWRIPI